MTGRAARIVALAIVVVTALSSGAYVFIYLYRWEWNRALIAGVIFIAAEIAIVGALALNRMARLAQRIGDLERDLTNSDVLTRIHQSAPPARRHFGWLTDNDSAGVFIPVLMGAGIVISGIAWAVERIAQKTARPVLERRLASRLEPIMLPEPGGTLRVATPARPVALGRIMGALVAGALLVAAVAGLADATQNRPDAIAQGTATKIVLNVTTNNIRLDAGTAAERLWHACSGTIPADTLAHVLPGDGDLVNVELRPALGAHGERRLRGCLEDATIDNIQGSITSITHSGR